MTHLTDAQRELVEAFERTGRRLVTNADDVLADPQVRLTPDADVAVNIQRVARGAAVHVVHYGYDDAVDAVPPIDELRLSLRLPQPFARATPFSPDGSLQASLDGGELVLRDVPLYGIVLLEP